MRAVLQRVREARVVVDGQVVGAIDRGIVALVGAGQGDTEADADWIARKIAELRIFDDDTGRMDRSVEQVGGAVLVVSQFTLYGDCRKGRRPSWSRALEPGRAAVLVDRVRDRLLERGLRVATGVFGASMQVELVNDGPVTLLLESPQRR